MNPTVLHTKDQTELSQNNLFPVFLKLENLNVLLVGGGRVAFEKLNAILQNAPATIVTVVAPCILPEIETLSITYAISINLRLFDIEDLENKDLVIIAVNKKETSAIIRTQAKEKGLLVNVADTPELCDFYLGSILQKGSVKIAISTNGKSPTFAKRLKEILNQAIPQDVSNVVDNLHIIRTRLNGDFAYKVKKLDALTKGLITTSREGKEKKWKKMATYILFAFGFMLLGHFIFSYITISTLVSGTGDIFTRLDKNFGWIIVAGFFAQLVDGATSMGYGVTSSMVLMSANVNPAAISGGIHTAEMFTSGVSGYSHYRFRNVNIKMFKAMLIPGVIGAVLGAGLLVYFGETHISILRPLMATYTLILGIKIFLNAFKKVYQKKKFKRYGWLAGIGGFLDSFGGGGWGPIVTATLITKGRNARYVVGSVSLTEFFVTVASAFTFFFLIGVQHWQVIIALVIGGVIAAPIAARLSGKLPQKASFILLGTMVILWSIKILYSLL